MQLNFARATAAGAAMVIALQLCVPLLCSQIATVLAQSGATSGEIGNGNRFPFFRAAIPPSLVEVVLSVAQIASALTGFYLLALGGSVLACDFAAVRAVLFGVFAKVLPVVIASFPSIHRSIAQAALSILSVVLGHALTDVLLIFFVIDARARLDSLRMFFRPSACSLTGFLAKFRVGLAFVMTFERSAEALLPVRSVVRASVAAQPLPILSVVLPGWHRGSNSINFWEGATLWIHRRLTITGRGSSSATPLIAWWLRTLCRRPRNSRCLLTRINFMVREKFSLIDLDGETPNKAEGASHGERLSERTPSGDATVWTHGNRNHERAAEMTAPAFA